METDAGSAEGGHGTYGRSVTAAEKTLQSAEAILIGRAGLLQDRVDKQEKLQQYICRATIEKGNGGIRCVKFSRDSRNSEEKAKLV